MEFISFIIYLVICSATLLMKRIYFDYLYSTNCISIGQTPYLASNCSCAYLQPDDPDRVVS